MGDGLLRAARHDEKDTLKILEGFDAIYLGAIGYPALVPDHITLWGMQQFEAVRSLAEECLAVFRSCGDQQDKDRSRCV